MQRFKTLADAIRLAEMAHFSQLDKAGLPYIEHPKRVLAKVQAQGVLPYVQIAAVLHDLTEDTAYTPQMLLDLGFSEAAVRIIKLLDRDISAKSWANLYAGHQNPISKDDYYYLSIQADRNATIVKLADIEDNLSPWRQAYLEPETQNRLRAKYAKALEILNPKPVNHGFIDPNYTHNPFLLR